MTRWQPLQFAFWGWSEYRTALAAIATGQITNGPSIAALTRCLTQKYAPSLVLPVNAGRTALRLALTVFASRRPGKRRVLLPSYICPSVAETVRNVGLEAIPVPVGADLNLDPDCLVFDDRVLAVVAAHMYGCPARIDEIERRCLAAGVYLIDDAAQVIGVSQDGRMLGTYGHVGLLSFAQSKMLVTGIRGSGGALLVNDTDIFSDLSRVHAALPTPKGRLIAYLLFLADYQLAGQMGRLGYYVSYLAQKLLPNVAAPYASAGISNLDAAIALTQLVRHQSITDIKIRVAGWYHVALVGHPGINLPQFAPGRFLTRCMVAFPNLDVSSRVRSVLEAQGIVTRGGYPVWSEPDVVPVDIPALLELPTRADMTESDVRQVAEAIRVALSMK